MRETCARVVAAALLTGAIATVVGMSALVDAPREPTRPIAAPLSSVQRSVRLTARIVPHHRRAAARVVTPQPAYVRPRPAAETHTLVVARPHPATRRRQPRQLAAVPAPAAAPAPPPAPQPAPAPPPAEAPAPADPAPVVPDTSDGPGRHGRGHAYGHDKQDD
jgi:hypothetical protein